MKTISISLSAERYAALTHTQELMLLAGGTAKTPEDYLQSVVDGACDSYASQYPLEQPSREELTIRNEALARAEAALAQEKEKAEAATAQLAEVMKLKETENGQAATTTDPA